MSLMLSSRNLNLSEVYPLFINMKAFCEYVLTMHTLFSNVALHGVIRYVYYVFQEIGRGR